MSARTFVPASPADERGIALLSTILMMVLMSALLVGFTTAVISDQGYRGIDRDRPAPSTGPRRASRSSMPTWRACS